MKKEAKKSNIPGEAEKSFVYGATEQDDTRRYLTVIIYDIVSNKRRRRLVKYLNSYAIRVQKSAFEGVLTLKKYNKMVGEIGKYVQGNDLLRVYKLAGNTDLKTWGNVDKTKYEETIVV